MSEPTMKVVEARVSRPPASRAVDVPAPRLDQPVLVEYLGVIAGSRWLIAAAVLLAAGLGLVYVLTAAPRYRSDILVQVEEKEQGLGIDGLSDVFAGKVPAETEMEILRSRSLLGGVVRELSLDVIAQPRLFPVLGGAIFRGHEGVDIRRPVLGLTPYAWGGERISLAQLDVPDALLGVPLTLVAGNEGGFSVRDGGGQPVLEGKVGSAAEGKGVTVWVSELVARPGTEFRIMRQRRSRVVKDLQATLGISEKGKKTGILQVALEGAEPARIAAVLDAVANSYLRQNVERKSAEAQKTLEFLETQLPTLKTNLESAESALEEYRKSVGSVNVSLETEAMLQHAVDVEKALSEVEVQRAELKGRFTENHPLMETLRGKIESLQGERAALENRVKRLPKAEMDSARLMRDAKVANELYVLLLNKAQELRVVKSGTIGNVRIIDSADVPVDPVAPKKAQTLVLSAAIGLLLGVCLAFMRRTLTRGMEDPEAIERDTGLAVYASVPRSDVETRLSRRHDHDRVLALVEPHDVSVESFRSLRTSLQFALIEAPNAIISVLGPAPSIGKSFTSANLAVVLGETGKRVLVVDADLRKGRLHKYFDGGRENGLSELISGSATIESVVRKTAAINVDFIATGRTPPNTAGLLGSDRFGALLKELAARYDFLIVDTAPVLAVTDGVLVARHCGINLMVLRAGKHPLREIHAAMRRFEQGGAQIHGVVLNDVQVGMGYSKYGGYHYQYAYATKRK